MSELFDLAWVTGSRIKSRLLGRELASEPRSFGAILAYAGHEGARIIRRRRGIMVVSCAKSGRTWLRYMLDQLGIHLAYTHAQDGPPPNWTSQRIIFLHRDPRDVLISTWFARNYRTEGAEIGLGELLESPDRGLGAIADFNLQWAERATDARSALVLNYEAMFADPAASLKRIADWLGVRRSDEEIRRAVEAGRFDRMRDVEASGQGARLYGAALAPGDPNLPESFKTRRGGSGGWREHFTEEQAAYAEQLLTRRGYFERMTAAQALSRPL